MYRIHRQQHMERYEELFNRNFTADIEESFSMAMIFAKLGI